MELRSIINYIEGLCAIYPTNTSPLAVLFMANTGMRPSDITTLEWKHVFTENCSYPQIRKVLEKGKKKKKIPTVIPISEEAVAIIERAKIISGGRYVFSEASRMKTPASLNNSWWSKVREETGTKATLYQLRHNMAHSILRAGGSIADVAAVLGNTVETCIRSYLNSDPRHAAKILTNINFRDAT